MKLYASPDPPNSTKTERVGTTGSSCAKEVREPKRKIVNPDRIKETQKTVVSTNDWSNIPYYPTNREKRENVVKYLISMGKQVPESLIKQIEEDKKKETKEDLFNNFKDNSQVQQQIQGFFQQNIQQQQPNIIVNPIREQIPHKFSQQYASFIGAKPRAQASAKIRLGGLYK